MFFNDPVARGVAYQVIVGALVVGFFAWIINNTAVNLAAQNKTTGFDFLWKTSGFDISFSLFEFDRASYYWEAFLVGLSNTILVAVIGIVAATILGFTIGVARLSSNYIISRLATIYIEIIRNIPLLLQLFFWYFAVLKAMPAVRDSIALPLDIFVNQRGIFVPRPLIDTDFVWVWVALAVAVLATLALSSWSKQVREATGALPRAIVQVRFITDAALKFLVTGALLVLGAAVLLDLFAQSTDDINRTLLMIGAVAAILGVVSVTRFARYTRAAEVFLLAFVGATLILSTTLPILPLAVNRTICVAAAAGAAWYAFHDKSPGRGEAQMRFPLSLGILLIVGLPALAYYTTGASIAFDPPILNRFNFRGGLDLPPEFVALFVGLSIYTAAFIAETVRAGIQAVSHGQTEAAQSLGLRDGDRLRLVVIPQAMRVIIPPLTSQYLNLTKNSSLGAAIGYPELVNVWAGTALNQTGRAIECIAMAMAVYLCLSLLTSAIMNWYNARVALVER